MRKAEHTLSDGTFLPSLPDMGAVRERVRTEVRPWGLPLEQKQANQARAVGCLLLEEFSLVVCFKRGWGGSTAHKGACCFPVMDVQGRATEVQPATFQDDV